jgi:hypothetical protein
MVAASLLFPLPGHTQPASAPLPSMAAVLQHVRDQAKQEPANDRAFEQRFHYRRTKITEFRNASGRLRKREVKCSENNPARARVAFLAPPDHPGEQAGRAANRSSAPVDPESDVRGKAFEQKDFLLNQDLLSRFRFVLAGRQMVNGRLALVVDFVPAGPHLPEHNLKDRFINHAAGRVWIDEAEYKLVRADLRLTKAVNVAGGLVGAVRAFHYRLDRQRTREGLWFTRQVDWHLEGREVFLHRIVDYHESTTDVLSGS